MIGIAVRCSTNPFEIKPRLWIFLQIIPICICCISPIRVYNKILDSSFHDRAFLPYQLLLRWVMGKKKAWNCNI